MNKKDLDRLKELQAKKAEDLTDDEKGEITVLEDKKETADMISKGIAETLNPKNFKSQMTDISIQTASQLVQPDTKNVSLSAFAELLKASYFNLKGDRAKSSEHLEKSIELRIKVADPMIEGTAGSGGYLVPQLTASSIIEMVPTYAQARQYMTVFPMAGNELLLPKENALPTWSWAVTEGGSITTSKPTIQVLTLTPKKGAAIVVLSNELLRDANIQIAQYVIRKIAQAKGTGEDSQFFNGSGSPFTGIFSNTNTFGKEERTSSTDLNSLTYRNLLNAIAGVDQNYLTGASWFLHRTALPIVAGLEDDNHRPLLEPAFGDLPMRILGFPVRLIENAPSYAGAASADQPYILLGNLQNSFIGDVMASEMTLLTEATIDATSLGQYDLSAIRVVARAAFSKGNTETYAVISTATV